MPRKHWLSINYQSIITTVTHRELNKDFLSTQPIWDVHNAHRKSEVHSLRIWFFLYFVLFLLLFCKFRNQDGWNFALLVSSVLPIWKEMIFMSLEQRATIQYYIIVLYFSVIDCSNCNALHLYCIVFCQSGTKKLQCILTFLSLIALCCIVFYQFGKEMIFMGSMERVPTKLHSIAIFFNSSAQYSFCYVHAWYA